ncbi:MAG: hypothetical protein ACREH4_00775 [Vitreimonas sp.]
MKPFLTIPEACVWAATREDEAVDAVTQRDPEGAHFLVDDAAHEAFFALPALCAEGRLTMYGTERDQGDTAPIPRDAWAELEISHSSRWRGFVAAVRDPVRNSEARWWTRLKVRSDDVLTIWPADPDAPDDVPASVGGTDEEIEQYVKPILERIEDDERQARRDQVRALVEERFGRLSKKRFDRLWPRLAPQSWQAPSQGRLPANRQVEDIKAYLR